MQEDGVVCVKSMALCVQVLSLMWLRTTVNYQVSVEHHAFSSPDAHLYLAGCLLAHACTSASLTGTSLIHDRSSELRVPVRQYRYGTTTTQALKTLYREGGVFRFYRGVGPALIQALSCTKSLFAP